MNSKQPAACPSCGGPVDSAAAFCGACGSQIAPFTKRSSRSAVFVAIGALFAIVVIATAAVLMLGGTNSDEGGVTLVPKALGSDDVAVIGNESISVASFDATMGVFAAQSQSSSGAAVVPDPPEYAKCIAGKRDASAPEADDEELRGKCEAEFETARDQIMTSLIEARWYELEARLRGITVSDEEVQKRFTSLKQQTFPKTTEYKRFLASTGQTEADLLALVRNQIYREKVQEDVESGEEPTAAEIEAEYEENQSKYNRPASRDLLIIFNDKRSSVEAAKADIESGTGFAAATRKYSQDSASRENGGRFPDVTQGQFEEKLDNAVFNAEKGELVGPIKTRYGYYLFKVTKITDAKQQTLQEASDSIEQSLSADSKQAGFDAYKKTFTAKWRKATRCQELYMIKLCGNSPEK